MTDQENYVVKINTALSSKPFFVRISDQHLSLDRIFTEAVQTLDAQGKPLEAQQLEQLYETHQMFNAGHVVHKGDLFHQLAHTTANVGNKTVQVLEVDLVTAHAGGVITGEIGRYQLPNFGMLDTEIENYFTQIHDGINPEHHRDAFNIAIPKLIAQFRCHLVNFYNLNWKE
jgi:hypothetical protein